MQGQELEIGLPPFLIMSLLEETFKDMSVYEAGMAAYEAEVAPQLQMVESAYATAMKQQEVQQTKLEASALKVKDLTEENEKIREKQSQYIAMIESLSSQVQATQAESLCLLAQAEDLKGVTAELSSADAVSKANLNMKTTEMKKLHETCDAANTRIMQLESAVAVAERKVQALKEELEEKEQHIKSLQKVKQEMGREKEELKSELDKFAMNSVTYKAQEQQLKWLKNQCVELNNEIIVLKEAAKENRAGSMDRSNSVNSKARHLPAPHSSSGVASRSSAVQSGKDLDQIYDVYAPPFARNATAAKLSASPPCSFADSPGKYRTSRTRPKSGEKKRRRDAIDSIHDVIDEDDDDDNDEDDSSDGCDDDFVLPVRNKQRNQQIKQRRKRGAKILDM